MFSSLEALAQLFRGFYVPLNVVLPLKVITPLSGGCAFACGVGDIGRGFQGDSGKPSINF